MRYIEGGERAVTRFEEGAAGYEARAYRGLGVFSSMPYEVSDDQDSVQMLQRSTQVGEFYRMHPPPVWNVHTKLPGTYADILVYDEEADKHQHIRFATALAAAVTEPDAEPEGEEGEDKRNDALLKLLTGEASADDAQKAFQGEITTRYSEELDDLTVGGDKDAAGSKLIQELAKNCNIKNLVAAVEGGCWVPFCIVIARPFIEHLMMSAIMTVSGRDTGATLFGPADMQISANTSVKTIEGHYTYDAEGHSNPAPAPCPLRSEAHAPCSGPAGATPSR